MAVHPDAAVADDDGFVTGGSANLNLVTTACLSLIRVQVEVG